MTASTRIRAGADSVGQAAAGAGDRGTVAAFDFDGTLTYIDTLLPFLHTVVGMPRFVVDLGRVLPILVSFQRGKLANDRAKEMLLARFIGDRPVEQLEAAARRFVERGIPRLLRPRAMARLRWHQRQGHRRVLASASLELYLRPWAQGAGFSDILGTRLEVTSDGTVTGRLAGANCFGPEKTRRLDELLGPRHAYRLYAYGDSSGDRELLAHADHAYYRSFPEGSA